MIRRRPLLGCALVGALFGALPAGATEAEARAALREDGAIALMRHAEAPGVGDPPNWRIDDCASQRNLSAAGRADAAAVGRSLRAGGARIGRVQSSPWCRCLDTARLLELGPVEREPAFRNAYVLEDQAGEIERAARRVLAAWKGPGSLLVVSHGENIRALAGVNLASGELVVVRAEGGGALRVVGRLPVPAR